MGCEGFGNAARPPASPSKAPTPSQAGLKEGSYSRQQGPLPLGLDRPWREPTPNHQLLAHFHWPTRPFLSALSSLPLMFLVLRPSRDQRADNPASSPASLSFSCPPSLCPSSESHCGHHAKNHSLQQHPHPRGGLRAVQRLPNGEHPVPGRETQGNDSVRILPRPHGRW